MLTARCPAAGGAAGCQTQRYRRFAQAGKGERQKPQAQLGHGCSPQRLDSHCLPKQNKRPRESGRHRRGDYTAAFTEETSCGLSPNRSSLATDSCQARRAASLLGESPGTEPEAAAGEGVHAWEKTCRLPPASASASAGTQWRQTRKSADGKPHLGSFLHLKEDVCKIPAKRPGRELPASSCCAARKQTCTSFVSQVTCSS